MGIGDKSLKYEKTVRMWRERRVASISDIDAELENFRILFAYNSGKIENENITYHDTREIFENGRALNFTGNPRDLFEIGNQKLCYEFLKSKIASREPLTVGLVLETHAILAAGTYDERRFIERGERPGTFKKHDYMVGREEVGSPPENVSDDLGGLMAELREYAKTREYDSLVNGCGERDYSGEILKTGAYFHLRFESIHPFADGNGRVGRTLLNYFLMTRDHPPLIVYDEDKAEYYAALEAYDKTEDIEPMYQFLRYQTARAWEKTLERRESRLPSRVDV